MLLELTARLLGTGWTTVPYLCIQITLTVLLSFLMMELLSRSSLAKLLL